MTDAKPTMCFRFWLWLIRVVGVIVPRRLRADWRQEWEAELQWREQQLAEWDRLDARNKLALWRYSVGAFADALWLQPKRWEDDMIQDLRYGVRMLLSKLSAAAHDFLQQSCAAAESLLKLGLGSETASSGN
jgi:hypothetical protein